ncbi:glutaredoxin domain-containing protein [Pseudomonas anguilliseptica]|uniref:glutaredoxin domain-containing protein n=1 Tax=Pseudomonas anguilliseptica TaxID=53406 RepID=UPI003736536D
MARLLLVLFVMLPLLCSAEIYQWTDESGRVHFGDKPTGKENAEQVSVEVNVYESVGYPSVAPAQAIASDRVVMYGASWCGYCRQARNYFQQNGIRYVEYDIETNNRARREYDSIGGNGVPVILVGEKRINGFSVESFQAIYP